MELIILKGKPGHGKTTTLMLLHNKLVSENSKFEWIMQTRSRRVDVEKPQDFIAKLRMKRAQHLLDNHPELNITEIAMLCAYKDTPNFTRAFKKSFGVTPTQYLSKDED